MTTVLLKNIWQGNHSVTVEVRHGYDRAEKNERDVCFTVTSDFLQMCNTSVPEMTHFTYVIG